MKHFLSTLLLSLPLLACNTPDPPLPDPSYLYADTTVVYECNERLFANNKCFQAIEAYLPTLQELQVNVLWLMPIHPRGTVKSVGSPYCVKDYFLIDPKFGTEDDLRHLIQSAHARGIKVMLDWVANHTAWDNPWYQTHPEWYTTPEGDETGWNDVVPLDYSKQVVRDTMTATMRYWVVQFDIDGFRCDYAHGAPTEFWQPAIENLRTVKPNLIMLAETSKAAYYRAGFDWLYSWDYLSGIQKLFKNGDGISNLQRVNKNEYKSTPEGKERLRYITSHDASSENAPSTFYKNVDAALAASCLTYFLAGVPMIYSSQEIGYLQKLSFFDFKVLGFGNKPEVTNRWKALMKAWKVCSVERYGEPVDYSTDKVVMFTRSQEPRSALVAVNVTDKPVQAELPETFCDISVTNQIIGEELTTNTALDLPAYGYVVLTK